MNKFESMYIGDLKLKAFGIKLGLNFKFDLKLIKPQFSKNECIRIIAAVSPAKCLLQVLELKYIDGFSRYKLIIKFLYFL